MSLPPFAAPVLLCALLSMPVGFAWFSPALFGKPWMQMTGVRPAKGPGAMPLVVSFLTALMIAITLAILLRGLAVTEPPGALMLGFLVWAAFDFLPGLTHHLFDGRPVQLLLINSGYMLSNTLISAVVLSLWF